MGTNYYYHAEAPCPHCGRSDEPRHIGKSSAGWCFSLHIYPDDGINDLPDWLALFAKEGAQIKDEYGDPVTREEMVSIITERSMSSGHNADDSSWYLRNHAVRGPNGLARSRIGPFCQGHGEGTWDLIAREFS